MLYDPNSGEEDLHDGLLLSFQQLLAGKCIFLEFVRGNLLLSSIYKISPYQL